MRPRPIVPAWAERFWHAAAEHRLELQFCEPCDRFVHPPRPECERGHGALTWRQVSGLGRVWAITIPRRDWLRGFDRPAPYGFFLVELEEQAGLLLPSDCSEELARELVIGDVVSVLFQEVQGMTLPQFLPAKAAGRAVAA